MKKVDASRLNQKEFSKEFDELTKSSDTTAWLIVADNYDKFGFISWSSGSNPDVMKFNDAVTSQIHGILTGELYQGYTDTCISKVFGKICSGIFKSFLHYNIIPRCYASKLKALTDNLESDIESHRTPTPSDCLESAEKFIEPFKKLLKKYELTGTVFIYVKGDRLMVPLCYTVTNDLGSDYTLSWIESNMVDSVHALIDGKLDGDLLGMIVFDIVNAFIKALLDMNMIDMEIINYICKCHPFNMTKRA